MTNDTPNIAVFCDFENVALGVRDEHYPDFDWSLVLARLLDKGKISPAGVGCVQWVGSASLARHVPLRVEQANLDR